MPRKLSYHGVREMEWMPTMINRLPPAKFDDAFGKVHLAMMLCKAHQSLFLRLEPGDGTRYELIVTPDPFDDGYFYVTRVMGGDVIGAVAFAAHDIQYGAAYRIFKPITNDNTWTMMFFEWWFELLFEYGGLPRLGEDITVEVDDGNS